jgi:transposase
MRKDLEGHVRGVLKVFGVCMTSVGTGKLRRDFRDQLAASLHSTNGRFGP